MHYYVPDDCPNRSFRQNCRTGEIQSRKLSEEGLALIKRGFEARCGFQSYALEAWLKSA